MSRGRREGHYVHNTGEEKGLWCAQKPVRSYTPHYCSFQVSNVLHSSRIKVGACLPSLILRHALHSRPCSDRISPRIPHMFVALFLLYISLVRSTHISAHYQANVCLCGLVVRVPDYRSRGAGFDSQRYQIFWEVVGLERGPLSLVRIIEELLERKVRLRSRKPKLTAVEIRCADHATPSIR
jgi:hypothetical protein